MPQRLVLCSPCAGLVDWLQYTDPDNRGMEPEATRAMMMDLALEDHVSRTGREELTPAELARYRGKIQKMLDGLAQQDARRAGTSDARVFDLLTVVSREAFVHGAMNCANDKRVNRSVGANETVVLCSLAMQSFAAPRPTDARRVVFAVTAAHEVVSYGGAIADWTYVRKLFSVHAFLGGGREPICMLAYSFPFSPDAGGWTSFVDSFGEQVDADGWGRGDGLRIEREAVGAVAAALGVEASDLGVLLRAMVVVASARANSTGQWNALEAYHASGGDREMIKVGHYPDGTDHDRVPFGDDVDPETIHTCGGAAVAAYPHVAGDADATVRTSPMRLLRATKAVLAERLVDPAALASFTDLSRALHGYEDAVRARIPSYYDYMPRTVDEANAMNQNALRFYGVDPATYPFTTSAYPGGIRYQ